MKKLTIKKWVISILSVIIIGLLLFVNQKVRRLEKDLTELRLPGLYLKTDHTTINLKKRSAQLHSPNIITSTPRDSLTLQAGNIGLYGIHYLTYLLSGTIKADSLIVEAPSITLQSIGQKPSPTLPKKKKEKTIHIKNIKVLNGSSCRINSKKDTIVNIRTINIALEDLILDHSLKNVHTLKGYTITMAQLFMVADNLNTIKIDTLSMNNREWILKNLNLDPNYSRKEYSKHLSEQADRIAASIDSVTISNPEYLLLMDSIWKSGNIGIYNLSLDVYRDKFVPRKESFKPMLSQLLRESPLKLDIDSINVYNSYLQYGELVNTNGIPGTLEITDIDLVMKPVRNHNKDTTHMLFTAKMMGEGLMAGTCDMVIQDPEDRFRTKVHISDFHYDKLNSFTSPNMQVLNTGVIDDVFLNIEGNNEKAKGNVVMTYHDFKLTIMDKKGEKEKKLFTAIANFMVHKENEDLRQESFEVERNKNRSFFNYMWLCTQKAMITTLLK